VPTPPTDDELVAAAQGGERAALDQLLRRHYDRIHAVCRRIAGSTRDGDDACQEALIKIVRSLNAFDRRSAFGTWAYRIATNAALDELRRRGRRPLVHSARDDEHGDRTADARELADDRAEAAIDAIGQRLDLDAALERLDPDFRAAVVLRDVLDLSYGEIAEILDLPLGTVKSRIARGRGALADQLRLEDLPMLPDDDPPSNGNQPSGDERPNDLS
jgi:RNA polymerase sigma-70 factor (ECF subfamily)